MSNVRDFGAAGDGVMDDTEALQHAIDQGAGEVRFPRGDYRISRSLKIDLARTGRVSINGSGGLAKIIMAGPGPAFIITGTHAGTASPLTFKPQVWQQERFPTLDGIEIEGEHPQADGVRFQATMQATMTRVAIRHVRTAVHLHQRNRNVLINACQIYRNSGIGIHLDEVNLHQCIISSSHISYCRLGGIRIDGGEIRNLHITGNDIEYNNAAVFLKDFPEDAENPLPTAEIYVDVRKGSACEATICSNTIQATPSRGGCNIRLIGSEQLDDQASLWSISGNLISNQESNIHLTSVWGVTISGNQIHGALNRNLLIEKSRNVVISGNMIGQPRAFNASKLVTGIRLEDSSCCLLSGVQIQDPQEDGRSEIPGTPADREALLELINCQQINLNGCQILDAVSTGLLVADCRDTSINNCQIMDQRGKNLTKTGIEVRGEVSGVMISNCQISRASAQSITGAPHAGLTLTNNVTSTGSNRNPEK